MVEEEELHHPLLCRVGHGGCALGAHDHSVGHGDGASRLGLGLTLDLDEAHAACGDRIQQRVIAEARDLDTHELGDTDDEHALGHAHLDAVNRHRHDVGGRDTGRTLWGDGHRAATSPKT